MKTPHPSLLAAAIVSTLAPFAQAQSADEARVVVTATRTATRASALLSDVSVIGRREIERAPQASLTELLQAQPGVQIQATGGRGTLSGLSIRGTRPVQSVILVDGQRITSATAGQTAIEHLPLNQIERIEILRGPAAGLYGADAVGGVVQVFTRRESGPPKLSAFVGAGTYDTQEADVSYGGRVGDTQFHIGAGHLRSGSFSAVANPAGFGFNPDRDPYRNSNVNARLAQRFGEHEAGIQYLRADARTHFDASNCDPFFVVCTNDFDNYSDQKLENASAFLRNRFAKDWTSHLSIGRGIDDATSYSLDPVARQVSGQRLKTVQDQASWQNDLAFDAGKLMLALEHRKEKVSSTSTAFTVSSRTTDSLVAGYQGWFGPHTLQLAARHDDNSQFGNRSTGSAAYGYQIDPSWRVNASLGTAFRAPTFNDLYWPVDFNSFFVGNPNLRPERARNREAGVVYDDERRRASLTVYHNRVTDLIGFGAAPAPAFFFTSVNVGRAVLQGATAAYSTRFGSWSLAANVDHLSARDQDTGRFLIRLAQRHGSLELRRASGPWDAGVQLVASGPRWVDAANTRRTGGFGLVNADASYRIDPDWQLYGRANNVLDKKYELVRDFATPGANVFIGVRYAPR